MADPDLKEWGWGVGGIVLLALPAFLPPVISYIVLKIRAGGGEPP